MIYKRIYELAQQVLEGDITCDQFEQRLKAVLDDPNNKKADKIILFRMLARAVFLYQD